MANALTAGTWQLSVQAKIAGAKIAAQGTTTLASIPNPTEEAVIALSQDITFGTSSGQCDIYCAAPFTIAGGGTLTLDLFTGTDLKNLFGGAGAVRTLKSIIVGIPADGGGGATGVTIGSTVGGDNALTLWFGTHLMTWTIKPNGAPLIGGDAAGVGVDATHKSLILVNNDGATAVTVAIALAGTSI